jgi:hypothetical protein
LREGCKEFRGYVINDNIMEKRRSGSRTEDKQRLRTEDVGRGQRLDLHRRERSRGMNPPGGCSNNGNLCRWKHKFHIKKIN